jgi:thymidylate kinase
VGSELSEAGFPVYYLRFRFLSLKSFVEKKQEFKKFVYKEEKQSPNRAAKENRFENFKLKSNFLFTLLAPYYLWKAYLFFLLIKVRYSKDIVIADRYIYDHLVHYRLGQRNYWPLYRAFSKFLPQPHLTFVLMSDFETVQKARPGYASRYIQLNLKNYNYIKQLFPDTVQIEESDVKTKMNSVLIIVKTNIHYQNLGG